MTSSEVSNGLVLPYFAMTIAGKGGAAGILLITFMAVTSTLSAQVIAVSSIISFDIYRTYFKQNASDGDVIRWSHYGVIFFALFASAFSTMLHYVGVDLGWTLYMLGVLTCPGIFPTAFTILWRRQSKAAAIVSPLLGMVTGIASWLGSAYALYGEVTVATTGQTVPCVWGTVASAFSPLLYSPIITLFQPEYFDWAEFRKERLAFEVTDNSSIISDRNPTSAAHVDLEIQAQSTNDQMLLKRWGRIAAFWALGTFLGHWVLWPLPMYASKYIFGKAFYAAWLIIAIIWLWGTLFMVGFYPLIDGRHQIWAVWQAVKAGGHRKQVIDEAFEGSSEGHHSPGSVEDKYGKNY